MEAPRTQTKTRGGIEPLSYEELCPIVAQVPCPTTPHTNPPQPTKLVPINLQFFKKKNVLQSNCNYRLPKVSLF